MGLYDSFATVQEHSRRDSEETGEERTIQLGTLLLNESLAVG